MCTCVCYYYTLSLKEFHFVQNDNKAYLILSYLILSYLTLSYPILSYPILSYLILPIVKEIPSLGVT